MSYDITVIDKTTGMAAKHDEKHDISGGTYIVGGTKEAWVNITYNYAPVFRLLFGNGGIHFIEGRRPEETDGKLRDGIKAAAMAVVRMYKNIPGAEVACIQADLVAKSIMDSDSNNGGLDAHTLAGVSNLIVSHIDSIMNSDAYKSIMQEFSDNSVSEESNLQVYKNCCAMARIMEEYASSMESSVFNTEISTSKWRGRQKYDCLNSYWAPTPVNVLKALCSIHAIGHVHTSPDKEYDRDSAPAEDSPEYEWEIS